MDDWAAASPWVWYAFEPLSGQWEACLCLSGVPHLPQHTQFWEAQSTFLGVQLGRLDPLSQANAAAHLVLCESEATVDPNTGGFWTKLSQGLLTFFFSRDNFNSPVGMGFFLPFVKLFQKHRLSGRHIVSILKHSFKSLKETSLKRAPLTPHYQIIHIKIQNSLVVVAILRNGNSMGRIILCVH